MTKNKMNTMEQDQGRLHIQDLAQNRILSHVQDRAQDPVHGLDQDLAHDQAPGNQEIDRGQGVEAVHANIVPGLAVDRAHFHIPERGDGPDPVLAVHITIGTKGTFLVLHFLHTVIFFSQ